MMMDSVEQKHSRERGGDTEHCTLTAHYELRQRSTPDSWTSLRYVAKLLNGAVHNDIDIDTICVTIILALWRSQYILQS